MTERPLRGLLFIMAAVLVFACMDSTAKYLAERYELPLVIWMRYTVHCLLMVLVLGPSQGWGLLRTQRLGAQLLRALLLLGITTFVILSLSTLPLAECTAIGFTSPLIAALLAGPVLGEKATPERWFALLLGFVGVLLIARPGGALMGTGLTWAALGALCYALFQVMTRLLSRTENSLTLLFYTALVGSVGSSAAAWHLGIGTWPQGRDLLLLCSLGVLGGAGHFLLIRAYHCASVSTLGPFLYVQLAWATLLGGVVFGHWPDHWSLLGMVLIVLSGVGVVLRKRLAGRW